MVGFDYHSGGCHPVFDGFVVCEEFKDMLIDAHRQVIFCNELQYGDFQWFLILCRKRRRESRELRKNAWSGFTATGEGWSMLFLWGRNSWESTTSVKIAARAKRKLLLGRQRQLLKLLPRCQTVRRRRSVRRHLNEYTVLFSYVFFSHGLHSGCLG